MSYMTICFIIYNPNNLLTRYLADLTHDTGLPTIKGLDFITRTFNVTSPLTFFMKGLFNDFNDLGNQFFYKHFLIDQIFCGIKQLSKIHDLVKPIPLGYSI